MAVEVKICGIDTKRNIDIAINCGVTYVGFVFYHPSPRNISLEKAKHITSNIPRNINKVGLFVDPKDAELENTIQFVELDQVQLHGSESPARVTEIRRITNLPTIKAIKISTSEDLENAKKYFDVTDYLLFDSKTIGNSKPVLPGGNATSFDWAILKRLKTSLPWMLAGGLRVENLAEAIAASGAKIVDVSSGVEKTPGKKDPELIKNFITTAKAI